MGIASLVLGILSLISMFLILVFKISFGAIPSIMAIVCIILGIMQNNQQKDNKATTGIILCVMYIVIFIIIAIRSIMIMNSQLL